MNAVSVEDIAVIALAGVAIVMNDKKLDDTPKEVLKALEVKKYKKATTTDPTIVKAKEYQLLQRGVSLPQVTVNDPADYSAQLDILLEETNGKAYEFVHLPGIEAEIPILPTAGKKSIATIFERAGRVSGLTIPLQDIPPDENWST